MKKLPSLLAVSLLIAGCGSDQPELKAWMDEARRNTPIAKNTVAEPKKFEPYRYSSASSIDPFSQAKLSVAITTLAAKSNSLAPDLTRRREPLENYPTDTIRMVGHIKQGPRDMALLKAENLLYQAHVGNYVGQNFGLITKVSETQIMLKELVQDAAGEWVERETTLELQESKK